MCCIFSLPCHWAGIRELFPDIYEAFRQDEIRLNFTIDNKKPLDEYVGNAESSVYRGDEKALSQLITGQFSQTDIYQDGEWQFPTGAFKGTAMGFYRILRCNRLSKGGFDPVPDNYRGDLKWVL